MRLKPALDVYKPLVDNFQQFERRLLQLMRHPDATAEDVAEVRQKYVELYRRVNEAHAKVCEACAGSVYRVAKPSLTDK